MDEFTVTPEQLVAWNAEAVAAVPNLTWRDSIDAAAIMLIRIASSSGEDLNYVHHFAINHAFPAAYQQEQPTYASKLVEGLYGKPNPNSVKLLLDSWWNIVIREYRDREHQKAVGSILGVEMIASLTRKGPIADAVRELFSMSIVEFSNDQLTHDRRKLSDVAAEMAEETITTVWSSPPDDFSALAFAAISVLTRCAHMTGSLDLVNAVKTVNTIHRRYETYRGGAERGAISPVLDPRVVNAVLNRWREQIKALPQVDQSSTLSAVAIDVLARILARLTEADVDSLNRQISGYLTAGPEALDNLRSAPTENDNHEV